MEGIKSTKVCVSAIEVMKIIRVRGLVKERKKGERAIRKTATRFVCIPGIKPVRVPAMIPSASAKKRINRKGMLFC